MSPIRTLLLLVIFFASSGAALAQSPCAADPQAQDAAACDLAVWMAAYGRMTAESLNAVESLRALASSNPQFEGAEARLTDEQRKWHERVIANCEASSAGLMVAALKVSRFMKCETSRMLDRTAALKRYVAELEIAKAAPGTKPPIAPIFRCPYTDNQLALATPTDACVIKAAAKRCGNEGDVCLVGCLATGGAKQIGGGCYHVCSRYGLRGTPWEAPAEATACRGK